MIAAPTVAKKRVTHSFLFARLSLFVILTIAIKINTQAARRLYEIDREIISLRRKTLKTK